MREKNNDTAIAFAFALLLHALPLALLLVAALWSSPEPAAAGDPMSADLVDPKALSSSARSALQRPPEPLPKAEVPPEPQPEPVDEPLPEETLPEPLPEDAAEPQPLPQEQLPDPEDIDQREVRRDADSVETAQREQDAKQRQGQVDLTERERQQQAQNDMQRQREQQLADIRRQQALESIRRERARNQTEADIAAAKLQQIADARARQASAAAAAVAAANASPPPGNNGTSRNLNGAYELALMQAIRSNWTRPDNIPPGQVCKIVIRQIPPGEVIEAQVDPSCPYDEQGRRSVEAAVLKAQPLPYKGFESVFNRTLIIRFRPEDL